MVTMPWMIAHPLRVISRLLTLFRKTNGRSMTPSKPTTSKNYLTRSARAAGVPGQSCPSGEQHPASESNSAVPRPRSSPRETRFHGPRPRCAASAGDIRVSRAIPTAAMIAAARITVTVRRGLPTPSIAGCSACASSRAAVRLISDMRAALSDLTGFLTSFHKSRPRKMSVGQNPACCSGPLAPRQGVRAFLDCRTVTRLTFSCSCAI